MKKHKTPIVSINEVRYLDLEDGSWRSNYILWGKRNYPLLALAILVIVLLFGCHRETQSSWIRMCNSCADCGHVYEYPKEYVKTIEQDNNIVTFGLPGILHLQCVSCKKDTTINEAGFAFEVGQIETNENL